MIVLKLRAFIPFFCTFAADLKTFKCYANEYYAYCDKESAHH